MAERPPRPEILAAFTLGPIADLDFSATYTYSEQSWGVDQADRYALFLRSRMQELAQHPELGRPISDRPGLYCYVVRWKRARHGHRIVYEETPTGIYILRILHTSMSMPDHLP
jgi:toxin ParE1/3/4